MNEREEAAGPPQQRASVGTAPAAKPTRMKKAVFFSIPLLVVGLVVGGFFHQPRPGVSLWRYWLIRLGLVENPRSQREDAPRPKAPELTEMDRRYEDAIVDLKRAQFYVQGLRRTEENLETATVQELDDVVTNLEDYLRKLTERMADLEAVSEEVHRPEGTTKSRMDNLRVQEDLKEYQTFRRSLTALALKWREIADRKAGRTKPVEEPPQLKFDARRFHPWGFSTPGAWVRHRIESRVSDEKKVIHRDRGVAQSDAASATLQEALSGGSESRDTVRYGPDSVRILVEEEMLNVGDGTVRCLVAEVAEAGRAFKVWIARVGRGEGWLVLRRERQGEGAPVVETATKVEDDPNKDGLKVAFKGRTLSCIKVDYEVEDASGKALRSVWYNYDVPGRLVKRVEWRGADTVKEELVDLGSSWDGRPPFPTVEGPPPKEAPPPGDKPEDE